jgi:hypothetical protein
MPLERIDVRGPQLTERRQPRVNLTKWLGSQPIEATLCVDGGFDEAGLAQHAQVFRDGRLRHPEFFFDLSDGLFGRDEQTQDCAAVGLGNDFEDGFHAASMPVMAYACQGI